MLSTERGVDTCTYGNEATDGIKHERCAKSTLNVEMWKIVNVHMLEIMHVLMLYDMIDMTYTNTHTCIVIII